MIICKQCGTTTGTYYKSNRSVCTTCLKAKQRAYRQTEAGIRSNIKSRTNGSKKKRKARHNRYNRSAKGLTRTRDYAMYNRVTLDTLKEQIHPQCENCNENLDNFGSATCSVANGAESIRLCPVWIDFNHYGIHPLANPNNYPYEE